MVKKNGTEKERAILGVRIRILRQGHEFTIRSLARDAGITPSYLSKLEMGQCEPGAFVLRDLAAVLGTTCDGLLNA